MRTVIDGTKNTKYVEVFCRTETADGKQQCES